MNPTTSTFRVYDKVKILGAGDLWGYIEYVDQEGNYTVIFPNDKEIIIKGNFLIKD